MKRATNFLLIIVGTWPSLTAILSAAERPGSTKDAGVAACSLAPVSLRCEYRRDPLGVDVKEPRLSWELKAATEASRGLSQIAYRIVVASSREKLEGDAGDLWDTGKIESDETLGIPYLGKPLASRERCWWKVKVWDQNGRESGWSAPAWWTMGLLEPGDWGGRWIGAPEAGFAAPLFRKEWKLREKPVRATAYFCGLGYGELYLNGRKVGDHVLDPGFTDYTKRVLYVPYDVSGQLAAGTNAVGIVLGNGWYWMPEPDIWDFQTASWRDFPRAILQLDVEYADGSRESLVTDRSWKWATGPVIYNCLRGGETINLREEQPGWDRPGCDDSSWREAMVLPAPDGKLVAQRHPPIRAVREIPPVKLTQPKPGVFVYDLGEYISGWPRYHKRQGHGLKVTLSCNEKLDKVGAVDMGALSEMTLGRYQTDIMVGKAATTYEPRFTLHGFRYVQLESAQRTPSGGTITNVALGDLVGVEVRSDLPTVGGFASSDENLNAVYRLLLRAALGNLAGIGTDCPSREKLGWTYDGFVAMQAASHEYDVGLLCAKWVDDMRDAQEPGGNVPRIVPTGGWGKVKQDGSMGRNDPWWGSSIVRAPWFLYLRQGDRRALETAYPAMKRYVDFIGSTAKDGLLQWELGDWLAKSADTIDAVGYYESVKSRAPVPLVSTAAWYHAVDIMTRAARVLGENADAGRYRELAQRIRDDFNRHFLDPTGRLVVEKDQTAPALALALGLAPEPHRQTIMQQLVDEIAARGGHQTTGIVGTRFLPYALSENGRADLAVSTLTAEGFPGFLHMIRNGATAVWEDWRGQNALNHAGLASPALWLFEGLAGIRPGPTAPGFKRIILKPAPVAKPEWVEAWHQSPRGRVAVRRETKGGRIHLSVTVPPNCTAEVHMPGMDASQITESGKPVHDLTGVRFLRQEGKTVVLETGSGDYHFTAAVVP